MSLTVHCPLNTAVCGDTIVAFTIPKYVDHHFHKCVFNLVYFSLLLKKYSWSGKD